MDGFVRLEHGVEQELQPPVGALVLNHFWSRTFDRKLLSSRVTSLKGC